MDTQIMREQLVRQVEAGLQTALDASRQAGLDRDELIEILDGLIRSAHQDVAP
jgi:GntR family transcriptional regulator